MKKCPTTYHEILGTCYTLNLNKKVTDETEQHKRMEITKVAERPTCPPMSKMLPSAVDKGVARESIRQAKAEAVQEGRMHKQVAQLGNKFVSKIAKALFNVSTFLSGKVAKNFPEAHKKQGGHLKIELVRMDKALKQMILGTAVADVSAKQCEAIIVTSQSWHKRSISLLQAAAMQL